MHIFEREIKGRRYRVLATSERVPGKIHPVSRQVSLGPVEDDERVTPSRCVVVGQRRLGDVGALVEVAHELGVLRAFDAVAPRAGDGPSLGEMILGVAIQRVCAPGAKVHLPGFMADCAARFSAQPPDRMTGQAFHRATRDVPEATYDAVQVALAKRACTLYGLETDVLAYDTTNFDTFIETTTPSKLAMRGHAKSKRSDLRIVGLALMTSGTGSVPLFHRTYAGNESDKTVLAATLGVLGQLHRELGSGDRTLVRDGGFYGEQLELDLGDRGYHSLTVLPLSSVVAREALAEASGKLQPLEGKLQSILAFRTRRTIGAVVRTLLVIESPELLAGQLRGMDAAQSKAVEGLTHLADRLAAERAGTARGRRHTRTTLEKQLAVLTAKEHVAEFIRVQLGGDDKHPTLAFHVDDLARARFVSERLGKRVLVTDQHDWSNERIVRAFRSQWKVERAFRRMKRGAVSPWGPSHQWTDDSLRAHTFATVLGLMLASLVRLKLRRAGIRLPVRRAFALLRRIRLTRLAVRSRGLGGPREVLIPPVLDDSARSAIRVFRLDRWSRLISATPMPSGRARHRARSRASAGDAARK